MGWYTAGGAILAGLSYLSSGNLADAIFILAAAVLLPTVVLGYEKWKGE